MKSSANLYKPQPLNDQINSEPDDKSEWTTVENSKIKQPDFRNKLYEKKRRNLEYRLNKTINEYLDSIAESNKQIFVMNLQHKNIQIKDESRLKIKLNKILSDLDKNYDAIKTSKSFGYFNKIKDYVDANINKLNNLVNENNFYELVGNNLLLDNEGILLSTKDEYKADMVKFSTMTTNNLKAKSELLPTPTKIVTHNFKSNSAKIKTNKSFASLFK